MPHSGQTTILIVEDSRTNFELLNGILMPDGYNVLHGWDGEEGMSLMKEHGEEIDVILLDLWLPNLNGFQVLEKIRENSSYDHIPVIIQTADTSEKALQKAASLGAYFFLTKPLDVFVCRTVVRNALSDAQAMAKAQRQAGRGELSISLLQQAEFHFKTETEALILAASLSKICPSPRRQMLGLTELMVNAIEHGNLAISQEEKERLIEENKLESELERRFNSPKYANRKATISFKRDNNAITFEIIDEGDGFDWRYEVSQMSTKIMRPSRRGIALAHKIGFDAIEYKGEGNHVIARAEFHHNETTVHDTRSAENYLPINPVRSMFSVEEPLVTASKMQKRFLPSADYLEQLKQNFGIDFTYFFRPSDDLGGDHWGVIPLDDQRLGLFIIDFSSKGASAAADSIWLDGAIWNIIDRKPEPIELLTELNLAMFRRAPKRNYATMLYGIIDLKENSLTYSTAGAPLPLIIDIHTNDIHTGYGKGLPLGAVEQAPYTQATLPFPSASMLLFYSDGIIENPDVHGKIIGRTGASQYFQKLCQLHSSSFSAEFFLHHFLKDTQQPPSDDATLICCLRK